MENSSSAKSPERMPRIHKKTNVLAGSLVIVFLGGLAIFLVLAPKNVRFITDVRYVATVKGAIEAEILHEKYLGSDCISIVVDDKKNSGFIGIGVKVIEADRRTEYPITFEWRNEQLFVRDVPDLTDSIADYATRRLGADAYRLFILSRRASNNILAHEYIIRVKSKDSSHDDDASALQRNAEHQPNHSKPMGSMVAGLPY